MHVDAQEKQMFCVGRWIGVFFCLHDGQLNSLKTLALCCFQ